jgi:type II secretory ATPase GspE/PulE/Tfp pilus assembly ATPase PilB-like protein
MLCPDCKKEVAIPEEIKELIPEEQQNNIVYEACGCEKCKQTGYIGKALVTEFIPATSRLRQMIINKQSYIDFSNFARKQGIKSIEQETLDLVLKGVTTADEFMRLF